jgi:hypothetical protein
MAKKNMVIGSPVGVAIAENNVMPKIAYRHGERIAFPLSM